MVVPPGGVGTAPAVGGSAECGRRSPMVGGLVGGLLALAGGGGGEESEKFPGQREEEDNLVRCSACCLCMSYAVALTPFSSFQVRQLITMFPTLELSVVRAVLCSVGFEIDEAVMQVQQT